MADAEAMARGDSVGLMRVKSYSSAEIQFAVEFSTPDSTPKTSENPCFH